MQTVISQNILRFAVRLRRRLFRFNGGQLGINRPQVIEQKTQRFHLLRCGTASANAIQRGVEMGKSAFKAGVMLIRRPQQNSLSQILAGD